MIGAGGAEEVIEIDLDDEAKQNLAVSVGEVKGLLDLSPRELAIFAPLILLTLWMGLYPSSFTNVWEVSVAALIERHEAALSVPRLAGL